MNARRDRAEWAFALVTLAVLSGLLLATAAAGVTVRAESAPPTVTPVPFVPDGIGVGVQVTQTSTEVATGSAHLTFWHNSTSSNASNPYFFPANMTLYPSSATFAATLTVSAGAYVPVLRVTQGGTTFLNSTVTGQVTVNPTASATPLKVQALQLFQQTGVSVAVGTYHLWVNVTESGYLSLSTYEVWAQGPLTFSLAYPVTAPYGYHLNGTSVFVPFPSGVGVNYTSVSVSNASSYQTAYGGVYPYNATIAPGATLRLAVSFEPDPVTSGPAVLVTLAKPRLVSGTSTTYTSTGNWTNTGTLPYAGLYVLSTGFGYTIDPASVTLAENQHTLSPGAYTVGNNNTLVIVPNALLVGKGQAVVWTLTFSSLVAPPSASIVGAGGYVLFPIGGFPFTVLDVMYVLMLVGVLALFGGILRYAEGWTKFTVHGVGDRVDPRLRALAVRVAAAEVVLLALVLAMTLPAA